jgi:hypothetical protein
MQFGSTRSAFGAAVGRLSPEHETLLKSVRKDFIIILSYLPCPMVEHVVLKYSDDK